MAGDNYLGRSVRIVVAEQTTVVWGNDSELCDSEGVRPSGVGTTFNSRTSRRIASASPSSASRSSSRIGISSYSASFAPGGWGARAFAENLIAARYVERHLALGDHVRVEGQTGVIERFDVMSTILKTDDGRRIIYPNGLLAGSVVEVGRGPLPPISHD